MKRFLMLSAVFFAFHGYLSAQTEKFDIATFTPPAGWERTNQNGTLSFFKSKNVPGGVVFCQIVLYPSKQSLGTPIDNFKDAWNGIVAVPMNTNVQPKVDTKSDAGWDLVTGVANVTYAGINHTSMVVTATGSGRAMSFHIKTIGEDYLPDITRFFDQLNLDAKSAVNNVSTGTGGTGSVDDYEFIAPPRWQIQKAADHIRLQNPDSGCLIIIFAPQPSSGDLEKDAVAVFETMYKGWNFQKAGTARYTLSKGYTLQGQEFFMMNALMGRPTADGTNYNGFEEGAALVLKYGGRIVIVSVRHNTALIGHDSCKKYEAWQRFFNTFKVKGAAPARNDPSDRIVGRWSMAESGGTGEYLFAANGNYAYVGALGSTYTTSDQNYEYLYIKSSAFSGDGSYSLTGHDLTLKKRGAAPEQVQIRFDQVNNGGTGWKDRIHMLTSDRYGLSEASYEKRGR